MNGRRIALLLLGLAPLPASAGAPAAPAAAPSSATSPAPGKTDSALARRNRLHSFVGEVVEILPAENRLTARETLRDGSPKTTMFLLTDRTAVLRGKDSCTVADIRVNDHVTIKYSDAPSNVHEARTIRVTPAAPPKPKT